MAASTGISGSSISVRTLPIVGSLARSVSSGSRAAATAAAWTAAWSAKPRRPSAGSSDLEPLGCDARQRLAAQRGVEDVRGDLGVKRDFGQVPGQLEDVARRVGIAPRQLPHEQLLDLVADERLAGRPSPVEQTRPPCPAPAVTTRPVVVDDGEPLSRSPRLRPLVGQGHANREMWLRGEPAADVWRGVKSLGQ